MSAKSSDSKKQPAQVANGNGKKQAIPSQKRANHEKHKHQNGQQQAQGSGGGGGAKAKTKTGQAPRELDVKVGQLTGKSDSCKEKIQANLDEFTKKGTEIKSEIERALERQVKVLEDQASVSQNVEKLRGRMLELSQQQSLLELTPETEGQVGELVNGQQEDESDSESKLPLVEEELPSDVKRDSPAAEQAEKTKEVSQPVAPINVEPNDPQLIPGNCFEPLTARLDPKTKFITLKASLERHFANAPELLEPMCNRLLMLSHQIDGLVQQNDRNQAEIAKLTLIKGKLGDLCRELQRSNNQIRIDSLDLIKSEQQKAKEQAGKIQATLAGVMKLFDENQQRNLALKQENVELQTKLKGLLDHCSQWEKCVETALKQREIENCLIKTELKRLSLVRTEEQERFVKEKQDLLRVVDVMRSHQGKIEDKEAKLREDLSSYASKYDECQEIIQKGLGKFQVESKRMLKQIEKSRQDYIVLLNKYESSNKKIKELLEEKQTWVKSMTQANKKVETLERLCRSLKQENDRLTAASKGGNETVGPTIERSSTTNDEVKSKDQSYAAP